MIKHIQDGYEETLKEVTKTFMWTDSGYVEIPKCSLGKESE